MAGASDRTRRFLAQSTADVDIAVTKMAEVAVELVSDRPTPSSEIALSLAATLLLRLDDAAPRIFIRTPRERMVALPRLGDGELVGELATAHEGFSSVNRLLAGRTEQPKLRLVFSGDTGGVRIASSGWACSVGTELSGGEGNVLAAAFGGVLGSAETLRLLMAEVGSTARSQAFRGVFSLWDYSLSPTTGPALPQIVELEGLTFIGCGGVGSAIAWPLSLLRASGSPLVVDGDSIDDEGTNLNRHLTADYGNVGDSKAELFAALLRRGGATPLTFTKRLDELDAQQREGMDVGVITVDKDPVRRAFQLELPRLVLNGGTGDTGLYRVTYHNFTDGACLGCISRADLAVSSPEHGLARRIGLPLSELTPYLQSNEPLPDAILMRTTVSEQDREILRGTRGRDLVETACARLQPLPEEPAVSAPMLAAAPGILLAGEIVKVRTDHPGALSAEANSVTANILKGPHDRMVSRLQKRAGCECGDPTYRRYFRDKWIARATSG
jgi:hypothetical protein